MFYGIFSLDNKKIYYLNIFHVTAVYHNKGNGPCFGGGCDIGISGNPIKEDTLNTRQSSCFYYKGDSKSLSEYDIFSKGKGLEYEVFQVIFY